MKKGEKTGQILLNVSLLLPEYSILKIFITIKKLTAVELDGRKDFDNTVLEVVIKAGNSRIMESVNINITRDEINEAKEGFMIVMRANEEKSSVEDVKNLQFRDDGATLGIIDDDDREYINI